jgi:hypothetical protein
MERRREVHGEVGKCGGFPMFGDVDEECGDKSQEGWRVWKDANDAGSPLEFLVDAFGGVGSAQALAVFFWKREDGEAFREVLLQPAGELRSGLAVFGHHSFEEGLGEWAGLSLKDFADFCGDVRTHGELGNVVGGVLLEMELAALPRHGREVSGESLAQAWVIVADDEADAAEAAFQERAEKVAPVNMGFGECGADTENGASSAGIDADGKQDGRVEHDAVPADLFVAGIQDEIGISNGVQITVAPALE